MFSSLVALTLLLAGSANSFALSTNEIKNYSKSKQWLNLLYIKNNKSLVRGDKYFIADKNNSWSPEKELLATIDTFKKRLKDKEGHYYQCLFPARLRALEKRWPNTFKKVECKELKEWIKGIDINKVFLVYTSAYPNNPASMFGHTFLRFDRNKRGKLKSTKELLGYSLAFQARTNPDDNPIMYTLKGILGGYQLYAEIKPHYMNIGVYNNGESRDLWEIELNLNKNEKEMLLFHTWELSIAAAFDYYFFDENCSTQILRLLEIIRPEINFRSKKEVFVVPQVSYQEIAKYYSQDKTNYRPAIKKKINHKFNQLTKKQKSRFKKYLNGTEIKPVKENEKVIDTLVDYWKFKNYKEKTQLKPEEKRMMYDIFHTRSKIKKKIKFKKLEVPKGENPVKGHAVSILSVGLGDRTKNLRFRYGFHDFYDAQEGYNNNSYIKFMDLNYFNIEKQDIFFADIIDILSLPEFNSVFKDLSFRAKFSYYNLNEKVYSEVLGGIGLNYQTRKFQVYSLMSASTMIFKKQALFSPGINTGLRFNIKKTIASAFEYSIYSIEKFNKTKLKIFYFSNSKEAGVSNYIIDNVSLTSFYWSHYF